MFGNQQKKKEDEAQQALASQLQADETFLAFASGNISNGITATPYHVGLTPERFIFLPLRRNKPAEMSFSIRRDLIKKARRSGSLFAFSLHLSLPADGVTIFFRGDWKKRASELAELAERPLTTSLAPVAEQAALRQINDLRQFGLHASARRLLNETVQANPMLAGNSLVEELKTEMNDTLWALRAAGSFLFGNIALIALIALLLLLGGSGADDVGELIASNFVPVIIDFAIGISLWRGQAQFKAWAILRAVLGFIFYGLAGSLAQGAYLDALINAALNGAVVLALTGRSSRMRTLASVGIYALGLGLLFLIFLINFLSGFFGLG